MFGIGWSARIPAPTYAIFNLACANASLSLCVLCGLFLFYIFYVLMPNIPSVHCITRIGNNYMYYGCIQPSIGSIPFNPTIVPIEFSFFCLGHVCYAVCVVVLFMCSLSNDAGATFTGWYILQTSF